MARKRETNEVFITKVLRKRAEQGKGMTHKEAVTALLKRNGLEYNDTTRKYYDPLLYGSSDWDGPLGVLNAFCYPTGTRGTWMYSG